MAILLIEPDRILAKSYVKALERAGHQVHWCNTGQQAIEKADENEIDLVILELQIAGHNGLEFLYEFRSYHEWQLVPVVVLSYVHPGFFNGSQAWEILQVNKYLYKPNTTLKHIVQTVESALILA